MPYVRIPNVVKTRRYQTQVVVRLNASHVTAFNGYNVNVSNVTAFNGYNVHQCRLLDCGICLLNFSFNHMPVHLIEQHLYMCNIKSMGNCKCRLNMLMMLNPLSKLGA